MAWIRRLRSCFISLTMSLAATSQLGAHPHVLVTVDAVIMIESGYVKTVRYAWHFDKRYVDGLKEEYDTNRDGTLSDDELQPWLELSKKNLDRFGFFTQLRHGRNAAKLIAAGAFRLERRDEEIVLHFTGQLDQPVDVTSTALQIDIYDATFFTEFLLGNGHSIRVETPSTSQCQATVALAPGGEQQKIITAFMKQFGRLDARLAPAKAITVSCK